MKPITAYQYLIAKILLVILAIMIHNMPGDSYKVKALEDIKDLDNELFKLKTGAL